ncbi:hypothetical protein AB0I51_16465 [Streptomyces sp. NPDC050549]|uniref:hypothetical protein n=1 Tax=Streptomyces sp. NPDC050549 TaxID=3155406 RepID=UPI0034323411
MSSPIHDENGAFGESDAPPNVYLPHVDAEVPSYDGYVDPAAAHGWQNAYDETRELPPVRDDGAVGVEGAGAVVGRAELRRRGARRSRRVVVAVGALGAVSVATLVVGFAVSGTSSDGSPGEGDRASATTGSTAGASTAGESATGSPGGSATGAPAAGSPVSARPSASAAATPTTAGSATTAPAATSAAPSVTATTGTPARGNAGHGRGATRHPK